MHSLECCISTPNYKTMADDKRKKGQQDRKRVSGDEKYEIQ
jgi:hypothetical protein